MGNLSNRRSSVNQESQKFSIPIPLGATTPIPVITTLLFPLIVPKLIDYDIKAFMLNQVAMTTEYCFVEKLMFISNILRNV